MREDDLPGRIGELIRHGTIETVDAGSGIVTVRMGEIVTQPLPWYTGGAGATRIWIRPTVGQQVTLLAPDGDIEGAVALPGFPCDAFPAIADADRDLVRFADGATIAYNSDTHELEAVLPGGGKAALTAPGGITIDADVRITGDVALEGKLTATDDVEADGISLKHHKHDKVKIGTDKSGEPV